jgi:hypothetical protein
MLGSVKIFATTLNDRHQNVRREVNRTSYSSEDTIMRSLLPIFMTGPSTPANLHHFAHYGQLGLSMLMHLHPFRSGSMCRA